METPQQALASAVEVARKCPAIASEGGWGVYAPTDLNGWHQTPLNAKL